MTSTISIHHEGIIESVSPQKLTVRFTSLSACIGCHAKSTCSAAEMQEKKVEVNSYQGDFQVGENVNIFLAPSQGFEAVLIGYVYPFIIVLITLVILSSLGIRELYSGIYSLSVLLPYYMLIFLIRKKLHRKFEFIIRKIE